MSLSAKLLPAVLLSAAAVISGWPFTQDQQAAPAQEQAKAASRQNEKVRALSQTQIFMRQKLQICNQILRGLSTDDFEDVTKGADRLLDMSKRSHWLHARNPAYAQDSADFVATVRLLHSMGKEEDAAGASLAYSQLMVRCSDCHRHVRGPKVAALSPGPVQRVVANSDSLGQTPQLFPRSRDGS